MKAASTPAPAPPAPVAWHTTPTASPVWGTVSMSRQPGRALPQPRPGCHLQVLLGAAALSLAAHGDGR